MLMPGLDSFPNGPVWTSFANLRLFFHRQALGYLGVVLGTISAENLKKSDNT